MLKNALLTTLLLFITCLHLSGHQLDSLYQLVSTQTGINQIETLLDIADQELPMTGIDVAEEALQKSIALDYYEGKLDALDIQCDYYNELGLFQKAIDLAKKILAFEKIEGTKSDEITAYFNLGEIYGNMGKYDQEFSAHYQGLILATEMDDKEAIATGQSRLAATYSATVSNYEKCHQLGMAAYDYFIKTDNLDELERITFVLGQNFMYQEKDSLAEKYLKASLNIEKDLADYYGLKLSYGALSNFYLGIGEYEKAIPFLDTAMQLSILTNDSIEIGYNKISRGEITFFQGEFDTSIKDILEGINIGKKFNHLELLLNGYSLLKEQYEEIGDADNSLKYAKLEQAIINSLDLPALNNKAMELEILKITKENELKLAAIKNKESRKNQFFFGLFILLLFAILFLIKIYNQKMVSQKAKISKAEKEKALREKELVTLKQKRLEDLAIKNKLAEELDLQKKVLTSNSLLLSKKEEVLKNVQESIKEIRGKANTPVKNKLITLGNLLERHKSNIDNWENFKLYFDQVHPNFFKSLLAHTPTLNNNDLRFAAYLKLNLNTTEIAEILSVAPGSIHKAKYRLKKKLKLNKEDDLNNFIIQI